MNKNDFIKLINLIVEKKLKEILPEMIASEIKKHTESGIEPDEDDYANDGDLRSLIPHNDFKNSILNDNSTKKENQTEGKKWTKNSTINEILNDTARDFKGMPKDPADTSYQQLLESEYETTDESFTFNTKNMANVINKSTPGVVKPAAVHNLKNQVLNEVPGASPKIVDTMVKDYSGMLKKMEKSAKIKRGGGGSLL